MCDGSWQLSSSVASEPFLPLDSARADGTYRALDDIFSFTPVTRYRHLFYDDSSHTVIALHRSRLRVVFVFVCVRVFTLVPRFVFVMYSIIHTVAVVSLVTVTLAGPNERRLLNDLLSNYNNLERPVVNESEPLIISFGVVLQQIIDVVSKLPVHCLLFTRRNVTPFSTVN